MNGRKISIHDLQPGDILLYRSTNIMAKMICWADGSDVSHAGLYIGNGQVAEALIVGNSGLNINQLSLEGTEWVLARRLCESQPYDPIGAVATRYLDQGNRYAFEQLLLLAVILLTRKVELGSPLFRSIARKVFDKANEYVNQMIDCGREPMICSEFVFRCYDEAVDEGDDPYSLEILSQLAQKKRRWFSRFRLRRQVFGATAEADMPTVHPDSLLATMDLERRGFAARSTAASDEISEAELDVMMCEFLGEPLPMGAARPVLKAATAAKADIEEVKDAATRFATSLADAYSMIDSRGEPVFGAGEYENASPVEKLHAVVADFVTPGDLFKSPSLVAVGKIVLN